jgi:hypothetical protein
MPPLPEIALGAVIAACIAALVSLLSLIISKEQKTSEFRQAWIDALRADISAVVAHANAIHGAAAAQFDTAAKTWEAAREDFVGINQATANIRLRLNSKEKESQAILKSIENLEAHLSPGVLDFRELDTIEKQLVADAQVLLKKEWLRVRSGEPVFQAAKWLFLLLIVTSVAFISYHLISSGANPAVQGTLRDKTAQRP